MGRRPLILVVRILLSAALLGVLFWQVPDFEWRALVPDWRPAAALWALAAVVLTVGSIVLATVRWQQVLHALDLRSPFNRLLSHYFAGQFVSNVLPTTIGGDVLRVSRLSRDNGQGPKSFASVVIERLTGWLVLPIMSATGFVLNRGLLALGTATAVALLLSTASLLGLIGLLWIVSHQRVMGRFAGRQDWRRFAGAVHLGVDHLRRHWIDANNVVLAGFAYQATLVLAAFCAARVIGIEEAGFTAMLAFIPVVLVAQVLPVGIAGLGIREGALVLFLTPLGVPHGQAIALGLALYLLNLVASAIGAPAFAVGGARRRAVPTAMAG